MVFLRAIAGIPIGQFIMSALPPTVPVAGPLQFLAATCSALLVIGLWTPIAALLMAAMELGLLFFDSNPASMHIVLAALSVALAMIGPGAWSVDARLFGRKRIRIPQS